MTETGVLVLRANSQDIKGITPSSVNQEPVLMFVDGLEEFLAVDVGDDDSEDMVKL